VKRSGTSGQGRRRSVERQVVVITGASSESGVRRANQFAERGATVVLAARNPEALQATVAEVETLGGTALAVPTNVATGALA
jgi:NADP-dependent 3-hydroxy acid dehydrogenase YdfG